MWPFKKTPCPVTVTLLQGADAYAVHVCGLHAKQARAFANVRQKIDGAKCIEETFQKIEGMSKVGANFTYTKRIDKSPTLEAALKAHGYTFEYVERWGEYKVSW